MTTIERLRGEYKTTSEELKVRASEHEVTRVLLVEVAMKVGDLEKELRELGVDPYEGDER